MSTPHVREPTHGPTQGTGGEIRDVQQNAPAVPPHRDLGRDHQRVGTTQGEGGIRPDDHLPFATPGLVLVTVDLERADGAACSVSAWIEFTGNPLASPVGWVAAGLSALGALGMLLLRMHAASPGSDPAGRRPGPRRVAPGRAPTTWWPTALLAAGGHQVAATALGGAGPATPPRRDGPVSRDRPAGVECAPRSARRCPGRRPPRRRVRSRGPGDRPGEAWPAWSAARGRR